MEWKSETKELVVEKINKMLNLQTDQERKDTNDNIGIKQEISLGPKVSNDDKRMHQKTLLSHLTTDEMDQFLQHTLSQFTGNKIDHQNTLLTIYKIKSILKHKAPKSAQWRWVSWVYTL